MRNIKDLTKVFDDSLRDVKKEVRSPFWTALFPDKAGIFFIRISRKGAKILFDPSRKWMKESLPAEVAAQNYIAGRPFARAFMWIGIRKKERRCPTWPEMVALNELLFISDEPTFQVHPAKENYINDHKTALHIWKPLDDIPSYIALQEVKNLVREVVETFSATPIPSEREITRGEIWGKRYLAIRDGKKWPTWEEVCKIKKEHIGEDVTALQFHVSREIDLNKQRVLLLWYAEDFPLIKLPPKEYV